MHFNHLRKNQETLIRQWLSQDYVSKFWHGIGLENTLQSISNFINKKNTLFIPWLAYDKDIPFGYLMSSQIDLEKDLFYTKYLFSSSKAITIDLLIGNRSYLGKGLAHQMIKEFLLQKLNNTTDVFVDPSVDNYKAIHVYEKVGFQKLEEFVPEWDPSNPCILMHLKHFSFLDPFLSNRHLFE